MNIIQMKEKLRCSALDCFENNFFDENFKIGVIKHVSYDGLSIEQSPHIIDIFNKLITTFKPKRIIEIGTFRGGLTLIMRDLLDSNHMNEVEVKTYDVSLPEYVLVQLKEKNISIEVKNLFTDSYLDFRNQESKKELYDYINNDGVTIILCDGGSKKNEFNLISDLLKTGDIIMAHDYAPNQTYFNKNMNNKIWNWMEIQDSDIDSSCKKNNLVPLMQEDFINVAWVCKIKK